RRGPKMEFKNCNEIVCEHDALYPREKKSRIGKTLWGDGEETTPWEVTVLQYVPTHLERERVPVDYEPEKLAELILPYEARGFDCSQIRANIAQALDLNEMIRKG